MQKDDRRIYVTGESAAAVSSEGTSRDDGGERAEVVVSGDEEGKTHSGHDSSAVTKGGPGFVSTPIPHIGPSQFLRLDSLAANHILPQPTS